MTQTTKQKLDIQTEISDIQSIMDTKSGRRFMWKLLSRAGVFTSSMTGNNTTFFNEGRRDIGLWYIGMINKHCLDEYILMMREAQEAQNG